MNINPEKIAPPVMVLLVGAIMIILGLVDNIPLVNPPLSIPGWGKGFLLILGTVLILAAIVLIWSDSRTLFAKNKQVENHIRLASKKETINAARVYSGQDSSYEQELLQILATEKPSYVKLLEFSTTSKQTQFMLGEVVAKGYKVQLLLSHPESAPNMHQKQIIEKAIGELLLLRTRHKQPEKFEIRCYRQIASLRGKRIGNKLISVSWFTYGTQRVENSPLPDIAKQQRCPQDIEGHTNPLINVELSTKEGKILVEMFDRVFDDLWKTAIPVNEVVTTPSD